MYNINNLAFEGGGAKGIAYVGVVTALKEYRIYKNGVYNIKKLLVLLQDRL